MNEDKQLEQFLRSLDRRNSMPSMDFEFKLRDKLLSKNNTEHQGFWNKLFFGMGRTNMFGLTSGIALSLVFIVVIFGFYYNLNNKYTVHEQIRTIEGQEEYGILTQVYANNPQILINYDKPLTTENIADSVDDQSIAQVIATPDIQESKNFNFFKLATQVTYSTFAENCVNLNTDNTSLEFYTFEGEIDGEEASNEKLLKTVEYTTDNTILDYQLVKNNEYFRYFGAGTTQLSNINILTDNSIVNTPSVIDFAEVGKLFGSDLLVQEVVSGDKFIYKIKYSTPNNFCSFDSQTSKGKIINILIADPSQNFAIIEAQYYFEYPTLQNQIMVVKNNQERLNLSLDEAKKFFEYDLPYPIKVIEDVKGIKITNIQKPLTIIHNKEESK